MATERRKPIRITSESRKPIQIAAVINPESAFPELKSLLTNERTSVITTLDLLAIIVEDSDAKKVLEARNIDVERLQRRLKDPNLRMLATNHQKTGFTRRAFEIMRLAQTRSSEDNTTILPKHIAQCMTQNEMGGIGPNLINFSRKLS